MRVGHTDNGGGEHFDWRDLTDAASWDYCDTWRQNLETLAANLAIAAALCRAWQQGLRCGVNLCCGYTTCGDGGSFCSDECEQAKECVL